MTEDDADLVALIDNELDDATKSALLARLATDKQLRQRYDELQAAGAPIANSFAALLGQAPLARLRTALPVDGLELGPARRPARLALRELAAGVAIGLLAAGIAAWVALSLGLLQEEDNWRTAVAGYMELYTNETFAPLNPDASLQSKELSALGAKVGANLTPDSVALPGLRFTAAMILVYDGSPLGEIAYVDDTGAPVLFCVIDDRRPDAPARTEKRESFSLTEWSHGGRGFLVIGRMPEERVAALAQALEARF